jgi:hypothetical protein
MRSCSYYHCQSILFLAALLLFMSSPSKLHGSAAITNAIGLVFGLVVASCAFSPPSLVFFCNAAVPPPTSSLPERVTSGVLCAASRHHGCAHIPADGAAHVQAVPQRREIAAQGYICFLVY